MAWQLIYTSAPRGLALGQSGFCTVARHAALRERLVAEIERFSSYAHLYTPSPDGRDSNPVISCHRILTAGGTRYHVLSKIRAAGFDYTRRTNHIAHHLICQSQEVAQAVSPAHMLRAWNGWLTRWQGEPRYFEDTDQIHLRDVGQPLPLPGKNWEAVARDPRFAALLLDPAFQSGCHVVGPPQGEELMLRLFEESLRLLDPRNEQPSRLWQIPFTTFLQSTDNAEDFIWRGCRKNRPLPAAAVSGRVVDLTNPARLVLPANAYVEVARTGERQEPRPGEMSAQNSRLAPGPARPRGPISVGTPASSSHQGRISVATPAMTKPVRWLDNKLLLIIGGVVSVLLLAIIALLAAVVFRQPKEQPTAAPVTPEPTITHTQPVQTPPPAPPPVAPHAQPPEQPARTALGVTAGTSGQPQPAPGTPAVGSGASPTHTAADKPQKVGRERPGKAAAVVSPIAQLQPPIHIVTEQQDINPILAHYFGDRFDSDILAKGNGICSYVKKLPNGQWPRLDPSEIRTDFVGGTFYDSHTKAAVRLKEPPDRRSRFLQMDASARNADWQLHFQATSSLGDGLWSKPGPFIFCLVRGHQTQPLFTFKSDGLELSNLCVRIAPSAVQQLARIRLLGGRLLLMTMIGGQPVWSSNSVLQVTSDLAQLNYGALNVDFTFQRELCDRKLKELGERKKQGAHALERIEKARERFWKEEPLQEAWGGLLKSADFDSAIVAEDFRTFLEKLPGHKAEPGWSDYERYLRRACEEFLKHAFNAPPHPEELQKVAQMLKDPKGLDKVPKSLESSFGGRRSVKRLLKEPNPNAGKGKRGKKEPDSVVYDRYEMFGKKWAEIFTPPRIAILADLAAADSAGQGARDKQVAADEAEEKKQQGILNQLPKTRDQLNEVRLEWEVPRNQRVIIALFEK